MGISYLIKVVPQINKEKMNYSINSVGTDGYIAGEKVTSFNCFGWFRLCIIRKRWLFSKRNKRTKKEVPKLQDLSDRRCN